MYPDEKSTVFFKNEWITPDQIGTDYFEHSMRFAEGISTELRAYAGENSVNAYISDEHFNTLKSAAQNAGLAFDLSVTDLLKISHELLEQNQLENANIKLTLYSFNRETQVFACAWKSKPFAIKESLEVSTSNARAFDVDTWNTTTTLEVDSAGFVGRSEEGNFFFIKDGVLYTPRLEEQFLAEPTRASIIEGAMALGFPVIEKAIKVTELDGSEVAFYSSATSEMSFISKLNEHTFTADWRNTIANDLLFMLRQQVTNENCLDYPII